MFYNGCVNVTIIPGTSYDEFKKACNKAVLYSLENKLKFHPMFANAVNNIVTTIKKQQNGKQ